MPKPTVAEIRRTLRAFARAHQKLRTIYGRRMSNATLLQIAQACTPKPAKKVATRKPRKAKPTAAAPVVALPLPPRPAFQRAIRIVMGTQAMKPEQITEALRARQWEPASNDPESYVRSFLLSQPKLFGKVPALGRGVYRVRREYVLVEQQPAAAE